MATMQQVADHAGVSIATVSFVVNGTKRVSDETTRRVTQAIDELGFEPNANARALASRKSHMIAMLVPLVERDINSFVFGAAAAAADRGYKLVLWPVGDDPKREVSSLIASRMVDGVLLMEVELDDPRVDRLTELGSPFALIGRTRNASALSYVDMDFESATTCAIQQLENLGHRNFALITQKFDAPTLRTYAPPARVEQVFRETLEARGLPHAVFRIPGEPAAGRALPALIFRDHPQTTAIVVMNDDASFGFVSGLKRIGKSVPGDVSVISLGTSDRMGSMSDPELTRLVTRAKEMGSAAALALIDRLEGTDTPPVQVLIPLDLHEGDSTAVAPTARAS